MGSSQAEAHCLAISHKLRNSSGKKLCTSFLTPGVWPPAEATHPRPRLYRLGRPLGLETGLIPIIPKASTGSLSSHANVATVTSPEVFPPTRHSISLVFNCPSIPCVAQPRALRAPLHHRQAPVQRPRVLPGVEVTHRAPNGAQAIHLGYRPSLCHKPPKKRLF